MRYNSFSPNGDIFYQREKRINNYVYSIDKFRVRFPLRWGSFYIAFSEKERSKKEQKLIRTVCDLLLDAGFMAIHNSLSNRYLACWDCFIQPVFLFLHRFKPFGSEFYNYSLILEFNPNKIVDISVVKRIIEALSKGFEKEEFFYWEILRCDYAVDLPYSISDIRILSRKTASNYMGTFYFGQRSQNGYTRLYDKQKEMYDHYKINIGRAVTRVEYENHNRLPMVFDKVYLLSDLKSHEVFRFVPLHLWPDALKTLDPRTARKLKQSSLIDLDINFSVFEELYQNLLIDIGLSGFSFSELRREAKKSENEEDCCDIDVFLSEFSKFESELL